MHSRRARTLTAWLAALAVLVVTLAPTVSHARRAGSSRAWAEVCTSAGSKWVQAEAGAHEEPAPPSAAHPFEHCPYCSVHADALPVPPAQSRLPAAPPAAAMPAAFLHAPRTHHAWLRAQPRAPPSLLG